MSNRTKGNALENKVVNLLKDCGWTAEKAHAKIIWINRRPISTSHDFFGSIDIMAFKHTGWLLVQVKSNLSHVAEAKRKIENLIVPNCPPLTKLIVWLKLEKRGFHRLYIYDRGNWPQYDIPFGEAEKIICESFLNRGEK